MLVVEDGAVVGSRHGATHVDTGLGIQTLVVLRSTRYAPQSTEVFYLDHGETANGPTEKVYVTTLVTPMGLASSFNGGIFKIMVKK